MAHHLNLLFTILCTASSLCHAMEIPTDIIQLRTVAYLNNMIVAGGDNGCKVFDPITRQEIYQLDHDKIYHIAAHPNKRDLAIASDKSLSISNIKTSREFWRQLPFGGIQSIVFMANNPDTLAAYSNEKITLYNYKNNSSRKYDAPCWLIPPIPTLSSHPTKNVILYPRTKMKLSSMSVSFGCFNCLPYNIIIEGDALFNGEFSRDGELIVINHINFFSLFRPVRNSFDILKNEKTICIKSMAFHPTRPLLALLTTIFEQHAPKDPYRDVVQYWNLTTKKLVAITQLLSPVTLLRPEDAHTKRLDFSPDGTQLVAAPEYKCVLLSVPHNNIVKMYHILKNTCLSNTTIITILHNLSHDSYLSELDLIELSKT